MASLSGTEEDVQESKPVPGGDRTRTIRTLMKRLSIDEHDALVTEMVNKEEDTLTVGLMTTDDTPAMDSTHTRRTPITDKVETNRNTEPTTKRKDGSTTANNPPLLGENRKYDQSKHETIMEP